MPIVGTVLSLISNDSCHFHMENTLAPSQGSQKYKLKLRISLFKSGPGADDSPQIYFLSIAFQM